MISEKIEKIKGEYTDKYVIVHAEQPELARFKDYVGQVKTVNMCGRALVEFEEFNQNIGWYDIDLDYLKVIDKPPIKEPKAKESKEAAKVPAGKGKSTEKGTKKKPAAAGEKKLSPLELARQQGAAKSSSAATEQVPAGNKSSGKPSTGKLSTADILAAARGGSAKSPAKGSPVPEASTKPVAADAELAESATPSESAAPSGPIDKSSMTPDEMCDWCREHDA